MAEVDNKATEANQNQTQSQTQPTTKPEPETKNQTSDNKPTEQNKEEQPSIQELMIEVAKLKRSSDKNASEAAEWKKKFLSTQSEKEQADMAKAEAEAKKEEEFKSLQRQVKVSSYVEHFMSIGYTKDEAKRRAEARADGDTDAEFKVESEFLARNNKGIQDAVTKQIYEHPERIHSGVADEKAEDPFLKGFLNK